MLARFISLAGRSNGPGWGTGDDRDSGSAGVPLDARGTGWLRELADWRLLLDLVGRDLPVGRCRGGARVRR